MSPLFSIMTMRCYIDAQQYSSYTLEYCDTNSVQILSITVDVLASHQRDFVYSVVTD